MKDLKNIPFDKRIYLDETGIHQFLFRESGRSLRGKKSFWSGFRKPLYKAKYYFSPI